MVRVMVRVGVGVAFVTYMNKKAKIQETIAQNINPIRKVVQ